MTAAPVASTFGGCLVAAVVAATASAIGSRARCRSVWAGTSRHAGGRQIVWHNGGTGGYRSFGGFVAGERAVVVLTNSAQGVDDIGFHLLEPSLPLRSLALLRIGYAGALARDIVRRWVARQGQES